MAPNHFPFTTWPNSVMPLHSSLSPDEAWSTSSGTKPKSSRDSSCHCQVRSQEFLAGSQLGDQPCVAWDNDSRGLLKKTLWPSIMKPSDKVLKKPVNHSCMSSFFETQRKWDCALGSFLGHQSDVLLMCDIRHWEMHKNGNMASLLPTGLF